MDVDALPELFDRLAGPLRLFARRWLAAGAAEDVVQEAFVRLIGTAETPDDPAAWLFTCVRRLAVDQHRRAATRDRHAPRLVAGDIEAADPLEAQAAVAALEALSDRQRGVVVARLWGGLTFEAAGRLVGCSAATAHADYQAALAALRRAVEGEDRHDR